MFESLVDVYVAASTTLHSQGLPWWGCVMGTATLSRIAFMPLSILSMRGAASLNMMIKVIEREGIGKGVSAQAHKSDGTLSRLRVALMRENKRQREAGGYSSGIWMLAAPAVQIPNVVAGLFAARKLATMEDIGMEEGGALWFHDLTQPAVIWADLVCPLGISGCILPGATTAIYLFNIRRALNRIPRDGTAPWYANFLVAGLEASSVPILLAGMTAPHAAALHWFTSMAFTTAQTQLLHNKRVFPMFMPKDNAHWLKALTKDDAILQEVARDRAAAIKAAIPKPTYARRMQLGRRLMGTQQWDEAANAFLSAAEEMGVGAQKRGESLFSAGLALGKSGNIAGAKKVLLLATKSYPRHVHAWILLAHISKALGNRKEAEKFLRKAAAIDERVEPTLNTFLKEK